MSPREKSNQKYKTKTRRATAKQFHKTGSNKIMRLEGRQSHLRRRKSKRVKRNVYTYA